MLCIRNSLIFVLFFCLFANPFVIAQPALSDDLKKSTVERIDQMLQERYVFPEIATKSGAFILKQLSSGKYKSIVEPEDFARQLTEDLQSINNDKHMRVQVRRAERVQQQEEDPVRARAHRNQEILTDNFGFYKVERLDGNVGYIDFRYFSSAPAAREVANAAMTFLSNCDALIFDMRQNGGGNPGMVQFVCSYLFEEKTHLNSLYWRQGDRTQEFWTLDEVPGKKIPDVPVFVLTSNYTFSGAEEFSYNLQTRKRATLVGEVTGGGANPGGTMYINDLFAIFIPTGKAINPVTNTNWEGVGVKPEVLTTAEEAYETALELAKTAAQKHSGKKRATVNKKVDDLRGGLQLAEEQFASGKSRQAAETVNQTLTNAYSAGLMEEPTVNAMGYRFLGAKNYDMAKQVFLYNVSTYPESFNVYDSLAEAYMEEGNKKEAIKFYKKSLEINPGNNNAVEMLRKMGVTWTTEETTETNR